MVKSKAKPEVEMVSAEEIFKQIKQLESDNAHILNRERATIDINAPLALMQLSVESKLVALNWVLGKKYESTLKPLSTKLKV